RLIVDGEGRPSQRRLRLYPPKRPPIRLVLRGACTAAGVVNADDPGVRSGLPMLTPGGNGAEPARGLGAIGAAGAALAVGAAGSGRASKGPLSGPGRLGVSRRLVGGSGSPVAGAAGFSVVESA